MPQWVSKADQSMVQKRSNDVFKEREKLQKYAQYKPHSVAT
jgi:hypothetical protein